MKILVTGSEGFIGTHLVRELKRAGHSVTGMDTKSGPGNDAGNRNHLERLLEESKPDIVVHLAAQVGRLFGEDDVRHTVNSNTAMTAVVAQVSSEFGARVVYASTSEVYGDNGEQICEEINGPWSLPHNLYGLSKYWGEQACRLYAPEGFVALRFSMPFGPGLPAGRGRAAIINMLWQARFGMPIPVHRGAERSWCWIGDTVRGARMAIEFGEGPYNVGRDDNPVPMLRVAELACAIAEADAGDLIEIVDAPARQTVVKRLSTKRLQRLGWEPTVELFDGMVETYETWVKHLDQEGNYVEPKVAA